MSVNNVKVSLLGEAVVRMIQHNMELNPIVQFELMSRPDFNFLSTLTINEIPFEDKMLSLKQSSGAFVEEINIIDESIHIVFDYFYLQGGSVLLNCKLSIQKNKFAPLTCTQK